MIALAKKLLVESLILGALYKNREITHDIGLSKTQYFNILYLNGSSAESVGR